MSHEQEELRMLYQITVGDLAYFKSQQWNVTYYALLIEAAFVGVGQVLGVGLNRSDRVLLCALAAVTACAVLYMLNKLQSSIALRDARLEAVRLGLSQAFQHAWGVQQKPESKVPNLILLQGGIVITTLLTIWLVACRLGVA